MPILKISYGSEHFTPAITEPDIFNEWAKENSLATHEWGYSAKTMGVYEFIMGNQDDYIAAKLRWL